MFKKSIYLTKEKETYIQELFSKPLITSSDLLVYGMISWKDLMSAILAFSNYNLSKATSVVDILLRKFNNYLENNYPDISVNLKCCKEGIQMLTNKVHLYDNKMFYYELFNFNNAVKPKNITQQELITFKKNIINYEEIEIKSTNDTLKYFYDPNLLPNAIKDCILDDKDFMLTKLRQDSITVRTVNTTNNIFYKYRNYEVNLNGINFTETVSTLSAETKDTDENLFEFIKNSSISLFKRILEKFNVLVKDVTKEIKNLINKLFSNVEDVIDTASENVTSNIKNAISKDEKSQNNLKTDKKEPEDEIAKPKTETQVKEQEDKPKENNKEVTTKQDNFLKKILVALSILVGAKTINSRIPDDHVLKSITSFASDFLDNFAAALKSFK